MRDAYGVFMGRKCRLLLVTLILIVFSSSYLIELCAQESVFGISELEKARLSMAMAGGSAQQVLVEVALSGKVEYPGVYQINESSGVIEALLTAGGICKDGSMRTVEHWRNNEQLTTYDLYKFIKSGVDASFLSLKHHDRIFVPKVGTLVSIQGAVNRPGLYEVISGSVSPAEVVSMAGGLLNPGHTAMVKFHFAGGSGALASEIALAHVIEEPVRIKGEVTVTVVAKSGQGLLEVSVEGPVSKKIAWNAALNVRTVVKEFASLLGRNIYSAYGEILRHGGADEAYQVLSFSPELILQEGNGNDLMLRPGDRIILFPTDLFLKSAKVSSEGMVKVPGAYAFKGGMRVADLLQLSGGSTGTCTRVYLVRRRIQNAKLSSIEIELTSDYLVDKSRFNMLLEPFDTLVVE